MSEGASDLPNVPPIGLTLYPNAAVARRLGKSRALLPHVHDHDIVVVSHTPPAHCLDRGMRFGVNALGSPALRPFVKRRQPAAVLCGHVHLYGGKSASLGRTIVVNAASSDTDLKDAHVAVIDLVPGKGARLEWAKHTVKYAWTLSGIGPTRAKRLAAVDVVLARDVFEADDATLLAAGFYSRDIARLRLCGHASALNEAI